MRRACPSSQRRSPRSPDCARRARPRPRRAFTNARWTPTSGSPRQRAEELTGTVSLVARCHRGVTAPTLQTAATEPARSAALRVVCVGGDAAFHRRPSVHKRPPRVEVIEQPDRVLASGRSPTRWRRTRRFDPAGTSASKTPTRTPCAARRPSLRSRMPRRRERPRHTDRPSGRQREEGQTSDGSSP